VLVLDIAQYSALGSLRMTEADVVRLEDTGASIAALTSAQMADLAARRFDRLDASDDGLALNLTQYRALDEIVLTDGDRTVLRDAGARLASLSIEEVLELADRNVDELDADDAALVLTVAQYRSLRSVVLTGSDKVTLRDTGANLAGLSTAELGELADRHIDALDATDDALSLRVVQYRTLGTVALTDNDRVVLKDTGANLSGLANHEVAALAARKVALLDATDDVLTLTLEQFRRLGAVLLTDGDEVTLRDTAAGLGGLSAAEMGALAGRRIDVLDSSDNTLVLGVDQAKALMAGGLTFADSDQVTVSDTGAALTGLIPTDIAVLARKGVRRFDATDDALALTVGQFRALDTIGLADDDRVVLRDTGARLASLTADEIGAPAGRKVDGIDATDDALLLSVAQYLTLGGIQLAIDDVVVVRDGGAALAALTPLQRVGSEAGRPD
jgi:hypothetical protein